MAGRWGCLAALWAACAMAQCPGRCQNVRTFAPPTCSPAGCRNWARQQLLKASVAPGSPERTASMQLPRAEKRPVLGKASVAPGSPERTASTQLPHEKTHQEDSSQVDGSYHGCLTSVPPKAKFLAFVNAAEQLHQGLNCITEAAFIANSLGRVLIEPAMKGTRMGNPWDGSNHQWYPLGALWDLAPICSYARFLPLRRISRAMESYSQGPGVIHLNSSQKGVGSSLTFNGINGTLRRDFRAEHVKHFFRRFSAARIIIMHGISRSGIGMKDAPNIAALRAAPAIIKESKMVADSLGRFACVQFRSETAADKDVYGCAEGLAAAALDTCDWAGVQAVYLTTDLEPGVSDTYRGRRRERERALLYLKQTLPVVELISHANSGFQAQLEMYTCARATVLVTCESRMVELGAFVPPDSVCARCVKWKSGFTHRLLTARQDLVRQDGLMEGITVAWRRD